MTWEDNLCRYQEMIFHATGREFGMYSKPLEEVPNPNDERFYSLLEAVNRPLWEGCVHSQLSLVVRILSNKSEANQNQSYFEQWALLMSKISPYSDTIPKDFYQAKMLVFKFGLNEVKIDCRLQR